jgi:3-hydroxybutyryl-CoA dehydrogenase
MKARITIVGAGRMGTAIAEVFARRGHGVELYDPIPQARESAAERLARFEDVYVNAGLEQAVALAELVIEAAPEQLELKQELFMMMAAHASADAVLATNTSSFTVADIAARVEQADLHRVIGAHFWSPPTLVPLVEVVQAEFSSPEAVARTIDLLASVGMRPVHVRRDIPGLIGNRMQHALKREAIALVQSGVCDAQTVDIVAKYGFGRRLAVLGPLEQADLNGLNLTLAIHSSGLLADLDRSTDAQPLLRELVAAGHVGMAAGQGFRQWTPEAAQAIERQVAEHLELLYSLDTPS